MAPKFRGSLDHPWDQQPRQRGRKKFKPGSQGVTQGWGKDLQSANATVFEVFPHCCKVRMDSSEVILCSYRRAHLVKRDTETRDRTPVTVGDRVIVQLGASDAGVIEGVCRRKNTFCRLAPGKDAGRLQQVLAANIDQLMIVFSAKSPDFSWSWVDKLLLAALAQKLSVAFCVTKMDLCVPGVPTPWRAYRSLGYPLVEVCIPRQEGLVELQAQLKGQSTVFCGQSGVGKTSLLRTLLDSEVGQVGAVNAHTGQGRHTTTRTTLWLGPDQSQWIDTPGMREFDWRNVTEADWVRCFPEMAQLACQACKGAVSDHNPIASGCPGPALLRYRSYQKLRQAI